MNKIEKSLGSPTKWVSFDDFRFLGLLAVLGAGGLYQLKLNNEPNAKTYPKPNLQQLVNEKYALEKELALK